MQECHTVCEAAWPLMPANTTHHIFPPLVYITHRVLYSSVQEIPAQFVIQYSQLVVDLITWAMGTSYFQMKGRDNVCVCKLLDTHTLLRLITSNTQSMHAILQEYLHSSSSQRQSSHSTMSCKNDGHPHEGEGVNAESSYSHDLHGYICTHKYVNAP